MPSRTINFSDDDLALLERAQELCGGDQTQALSGALQRFVEVRDAYQHGYEEVTVQVGSASVPRYKRFVGVRIGRWHHRPSQGPVVVYDIFRSRQGRFLLHTQSVADWTQWSPAAGWDWTQYESPDSATLEVVDALEQLADRLPVEIFQRLRDAAGQPVLEELDV